MFNRAKTSKIGASLQENSTYSEFSANWNPNDPQSGDKLRDKITQFVGERKARSQAIQMTQFPKKKRHSEHYQQLQQDVDQNVPQIDKQGHQNRTKMIVE
jgi:hypothetical protein